MNTPDEFHRQETVELANRLIAASVRRNLPGKAVNRIHSGLETQDYISLINRASILALEEDPAARTLAYEISTHALGMKDQVKSELVAAVDFLLARLGNFPGRQLLRQRYPNAADARRSPSLQLEAIAREAENTIPEFTRPLTDFQLELLQQLKCEKAVSISAPTSAGKSFVLCLRILRCVRANPTAKIAYIVPTRALIREVMLRLRKEFGDAGLTDIGLRCVPQPPTPDAPDQGIIFVLTQERLLSLLHSSDGKFKFDLLVVDEAQGISKEKKERDIVSMQY